MTPEQAAEAIRMRQAHCQHAFAKGAADRSAQCVHCGLPERDYQPVPAWSP